MCIFKYTTTSSNYRKSMIKKKILERSQREKHFTSKGLKAGIIYYFSETMQANESEAKYLKFQ
jgi:hypothetical protein